MDIITADGQHQLQTQLEAHVVDPDVEKLLLATDGGPAGEGALRWIARRGTMHRVDVDIMTVVETTWLTQALEPEATWGRASTASSDVTRAWLDEVMASAMADAERLQHHLQSLAPSEEVHVRVVEGDARDAFGAASADADMIVVGSNRTGAASSLLGSTFSMKLVEGAQCPAIVVPRGWTAGTGPVVLGLQGDSSDDAAGRFALDEAAGLHAPLRVVHAWTPPSVVSAGARHEEATRLHTAVLERAVDQLRGRDPSVPIEGILVEGEPSDILSEEAESAQLLVVGAHRRGRLDRFFVGSVGREILARPRCPVAVVRPPA